MITHKHTILTLYKRTGQISTTRTCVIKAYSTKNPLVFFQIPDHQKSDGTFIDIHGNKKDCFLPAMVQKTAFFILIIIRITFSPVLPQGK